MRKSLDITAEDCRLKLQTDILGALNRVYVEDRELLADRIDVCERSLMHRFTHYFMLQVESGSDDFYDGLKVDAEYNRHGYETKTLYSGRSIFPDVIVHRRGDDTRNLCVIEFKKHIKVVSLDKPDVADGRKLRFLTDENAPFRYSWGAYVVFHAAIGGHGFNGVSVRWYQGGRCAVSIRKFRLPLGDVIK